MKRRAVGNCGTSPPSILYSIGDVQKCQMSKLGLDICDAVFTLFLNIQLLAYADLCSAPAHNTQPSVT
jgi:hypothetical protein